MAIYRMTKEEVEKRKLMIEEDTGKIKEFEKIFASPAMIKKKLIEELNDVDVKLEEIMRLKEVEKKKVYKTLEKASKVRKKQ